MDPAVSQLVLLLVVAVFGYFVLIRPQRAQRQRQAELINSLKPGDRIITIGGFYGTVEALEGDDIRLELGPGSHATVVKAAVARRVVDVDVDVDEPDNTGGATAAGE